MGFAHLAALGLVLIILRCMIVTAVKLVYFSEMRKTDCFGETKLVLHVPSSSHESKFIVIIIIVIRHHRKSAAP